MADRPVLKQPLESYVFETYPIPNIIREMTEKYYEVAVERGSVSLDLGYGTLYADESDTQYIGRSVIAIAYLLTAGTLIDRDYNCLSGEAEAECTAESSRCKNPANKLTTKYQANPPTPQMYQRCSETWNDFVHIIKPYVLYSHERRRRRTTYKIDIRSARQKIAIRSTTQSLIDDGKTVSSELQKIYQSRDHHRAMRRLRKSQYAQYLLWHEYTVETDPWHVKKRMKKAEYESRWQKRDEIFRKALSTE